MKNNVLQFPYNKTKQGRIEQQRQGAYITITTSPLSKILDYPTCTLITLQGKPLPPDYTSENLQDLID